MKSIDPPKRRTMLLAAATFMVGGATRAATPPINTLKNSALFSSRTDTAINGYDTVAYFAQNRAVKGLDSLTHHWMGATWKFSSQAHRDLFKANPAEYAPQYGGYCAYGAAQGYLVKVDPAQFTVREGKLYLNYDAKVQATWSKDILGYTRAADEKFAALLKK